MGPIRAQFWLPSAPLASWTRRNWRKTDRASGIGPIPRSKMAIFLSYGRTSPVSLSRTHDNRTPYISAAIGAVGPHVRSRVARIKNIFELLTVVYARVAHHVTAHEFVPAIDADMVLVTEIRAFMLLRPARVLVLLAVLGGLGFPVFRRFAFLDRLVLLARIVLLGR